MNTGRGGRNWRRNWRPGNSNYNRNDQSNENNYNSDYRNYNAPQPNFAQPQAHRGRGSYFQNNWRQRSGGARFRSPDQDNEYNTFQDVPSRLMHQSHQFNRYQRNYSNFTQEGPSHCATSELFAFKNYNEQGSYTDSDMESVQSFSKKSGTRKHRKRNKNQLHASNMADNSCSMNNQVVEQKSFNSISRFKSLQADLKTAMQSISTDDLVKQCRQEITEETEKYLQKQEKSFKVIAEFAKNSANKKKEVWLEHQNIIKKQQMSFDQSISSLRSDLTDVYSLSNVAAVSRCETIMEEVKRECELFGKCLPIYAFKNDIIKSVEENSVTIVSADSCYNASAVIPHFLLRAFTEGLIVSCHPTVSLCNFFYRFSMCLTDNSDSTSFVACELESGFLKAKDTKILFTTHNQLFESSIEESNFPMMSCIVFNCTLQRETQTDFLLETLKRCLSVRNNFRLIITVQPTQNILSFEKYFAISSGPGVISLPNLTLPVSTVWKKGESSDEYLKDIVETVFAIYVLNDPGDVLIFVPSEKDIKKASITVNTKLRQSDCHDFLCECVYEDSVMENLFPATQSKLTKRKFIFTTDWALQVDFQSVAYVIDSGLMWNTYYDPEVGLEVKKYKYISQASAKMRKSAAGRTSYGTCYRLYNKHIYKYEMPLQELPQILLENPFDVVMKTFQHRPNDGINVEFVENLPEEAKEKALASLEKANAIKNGKLTHVGEEIIKLPFLPRYSKMLILGEQWGYGYETILLVAFFMIRQPIFLYFSEKKQQQKSEVQKLQFLVDDSDTLTFLNVYHLWNENKNQSCWCDENCINYDVLMKIQEQAAVIHKIVTQKLQADVVAEVRSIPQLDLKALQEIIYECFKDNLCIYSGHYRSGYHSYSTQCMIFLHPSSPILQKAELPQFVVFQSLQTTSRKFMMNVTSICPKKVMNDKSVDLTSSQVLQIKLEPFVIENVGIALIKRFFLGMKGHKLYDIEQQIKKQIDCNMLVIEPSEENGTITVFTSPEYGQIVKTFIQNFLQKKMKDVLQEKETCPVALQHGQKKMNVSVTWMKGCSTIDLKVNSVNTVLNDNKGDIPKDISSIIYSINLTWPRRLGRGIGYVTFSDSSFAIARRLSTMSLMIGISEATVQISKTYPNQLFISKLDPTVTKEDLKHIIRGYLPSSVSIINSTIVHQNGFETTDEDILEIRTILEKTCHNLMNLDDFAIDIPMPEASATEMRVFVNLKKPDDVKRITEYFSRFRMNELRITAKAVYTSFIFCNVKVYKALEKRLYTEFNELERKFRSSKKFIAGSDLFRFSEKIGSDAVTVEIKLQSNYGDIINVLCDRLNHLLEGVLINRLTMKGVHKLFTHGGHLWLRALETEENTHIFEDYKFKMLRLYGTENACAKAVERIRTFLADVENEVVRPVDLSYGGNTRTILKDLIQRYGVDLKTFIEKFDLRSADLNIRQCKLTLHGSGANIEEALNEIEELVLNSSSQTDDNFSLQKSCCICRMPPLHLSILLEHCAHLYCMECLKGLIFNSEFPISCCAEDCDKEIVLEDIHKVLDDEAQSISDLLNRSMADYISKNSQRFVYCPAPDCSMFFDKNQMLGTIWTCQLCGNDICPKCNIVYHRGSTCEMYQGSKNDPDFSYKQWLKNTKANCKQCPNCQTAIEKTEGCNHMTCRNCRGHFCWLCTQEFRTGNEVYNHLPHCRYYGK